VPPSFEGGETSSAILHIAAQKTEQTSIGDVENKKIGETL